MGLQEVITDTNNNTVILTNNIIINKRSRARGTLLLVWNQILLVVFVFENRRNFVERGPNILKKLVHTTM
jgi:hypothetical protein